MRSIHIVEDSLPFAWEKALLETWETGESFKTEYDKPDDPLSKDVTAMIHVRQPFLEPRIHRGFPGGLDDLEKYRQEVLFGVHDHWVDPSVGKWEYTYHERLFEYDVPGKGLFNQIEGVIEKLKQAPHTRRAQAVTWKVWEDMNIGDPACLQRMWFRVSEEGKLNMNVHMRSNDAFKAGFMNMYAFIELQKFVAESVGVETGEYIHIADSFHIYGSYFNQFEGFLKMTRERSPEQRTYDSSFAEDFFYEGREKLLAESDLPAKHRVRLEQELRDRK
jgi:thymidylate synthase